MSLPKTVKAVVVQAVSIRSRVWTHADTQVGAGQNQCNPGGTYPNPRRQRNSSQGGSDRRQPNRLETFVIPYPYWWTSSKLMPSPFADTKWLTKPGAYVGNDFAGEVVQVGPNVKTNVKVGDKVASSVRGGVSSERGAFSEFAKTFADLAFIIPEGTWSVEEASTIGIPYVAHQPVYDPRPVTSMSLACTLLSRPCTERRP